MILDEKQRRGWNSSQYSHTFAEIRAAAAVAMPSLADALNRDLRDTAVTWLARAGCTLSEVAQITGHSMDSVADVLKH